MGAIDDEVADALEPPRPNDAGELFDLRLFDCWIATPGRAFAGIGRTPAAMRFWFIIDANTSPIVFAEEEESVLCPPPPFSSTSFGSPDAVSNASAFVRACCIALNIACMRDAVAQRNSDETTFDLIVVISVSNISNASFLYSMSGSR